MKTIEESVVTALDGNHPELYKYLPYILQDFWEIGACSNTIIKLVKKHTKAGPGIKVLDLGCGKGAVSINLVRSTGCCCYGIDAVESFINEAGQKAAELKASYLCRFEVNDIRTRIKSLRGFDVIILGSVGPVLGNYYETLKALKNCLNPNGIVIIDDGYIDDDSKFNHHLNITWSDLMQQISTAGMVLIDEVMHETTQKEKETHQQEISLIERRCIELIKKHPEDATLFNEYLLNQKTEYDVIENRIICSTMVFKPVLGM